MKNAELLLYTHGKPLADKPVSTITPDMVEAALQELWARAPNQGRRTLGMWERVLNYAKAKGWRQGDNPCAWEACHEFRFARRRAQDKGHHPAMDYAQLPQFMRDLRIRQDKGTWALALEFLILTCARTNEVLQAQWSEIDWDQRLWTLSADRMKGSHNG
jgi:integrase